MDQYVAERNATRSRVSGLEAHRAFAPGEGPLTYAGRRVVDGQALALLRSGDEVLVMEVHPDQAARMARFKPGQKIEVREGRMVTPRSANTPQPENDTSLNRDSTTRGGAPRKTRPTR